VFVLHRSPPTRPPVASCRSNNPAKEGAIRQSGATRWMEKFPLYGTPLGQHKIFVQAIGAFEAQFSNALDPSALPLCIHNPGEMLWSIYTSGIEQGPDPPLRQ